MGIYNYYSVNISHRSKEFMAAYSQFKQPLVNFNAIPTPPVRTREHLYADDFQLFLRRPVLIIRHSVYIITRSSLACKK
jgi:hypothetical protein